MAPAEAGDPEPTTLGQQTLTALCSPAQACCCLCCVLWRQGCVSAQRATAAWQQGVHLKRLMCTEPAAAEARTCLSWWGLGWT